MQKTARLEVQSTWLFSLFIHLVYSLFFFRLSSRVFERDILKRNDCRNNLVSFPSSFAWVSFAASLPRSVLRNNARYVRHRRRLTRGAECYFQLSASQSDARVRTTEGNMLIYGWLRCHDDPLCIYSPSAAWRRDKRRPECDMSTLHLRRNDHVYAAFISGNRIGKAFWKMSAWDRLFYRDCQA